MNYVSCVIFLLGGAVGFAFGLWLMFHRIFRRTNGTLVIDQRDPDTDRYRLDFDTDLNAIPTYNFMVFRVRIITSRKNSSLSWAEKPKFEEEETYL